MKRSDFKPALSIDSRERFKNRVREVLRYVSSYREDFCNSVKSITELSGNTIEFTRLALKHLQNCELIERTHLLDDEGMIRGSGYIRTFEGDQIIKSYYGE